MPLGDDDLDVFTADFGVAVIYGNATARGLLDSPSSIVNVPSGSGGSSQREICVTLALNGFSVVPKAMEQLTVDGSPYTVRNPPEYIGDGKFYRLYLKAVV